MLKDDDKMPTAVAKSYYFAAGQGGWLTSPQGITFRLCGLETHIARSVTLEQSVSPTSRFQNEDSMPFAFVMRVLFCYLSIALSVRLSIT